MSGVSEAAAPEVQFRSDVTVELVRSSASDSDVLFAARVSTLGEKTLESASAAPGDPADADDYEVSDMGSTNGTKINGIPVARAQILRDGDTVTVGATAIRFERG